MAKAPPVSTRIRAHLRSNLIGYMALFVALGGTAYAVDGPLPGQNQVGSEDIINFDVRSPDIALNSIGSGKIFDGQVQTNDVADDTTSFALTGTDIANDSLTDADLGQSSVGTSEVADDSLSALDLAPGSVGTSEVADGSLTGADVANTNSLTGPEINEATLTGVAHTSGLSGCCRIIGDEVVTSDPYSPSNSATWVDLGFFELRSPTSDNSAGSGFRLCNTAGVSFRVFVYVGGSVFSTADTRSSPSASGGTCTSVDYNGSDTDGFGDFRLHLPIDHVVVFGNGTGAASTGVIEIFAIGT